MLARRPFFCETFVLFLCGLCANRFGFIFCSQLVEELSIEVERLRESALRQSSREKDPDQAAQVLALDAQLERMREEARSLREANEELQALVLTRGIEEGRSLLTGGSSSLAAELEAMSQDEVCTRIVFRPA